MNNKDVASWIGVDWGTTNLRVWVMGNGPEPIAFLDGPFGAGGLSQAEFEPALLHLIAPYLSKSRRLPVLCCGMAGSRQGWAEAAYHAVPCKTPGLPDATEVSTRDPRISVHILPGIKQDSPADVMRGEETQISGFLNENKEFDGVLCLPGTHTKWVHISAEEIVSFQTFMTGELFSLLSQRSMLSAMMTGDGWDAAAFSAAVDDAISRPQSIAAKLFNIRADALVNTPKNAVSRARLSGYLIGIELAASRPYWLGQNVVLIGDPKVSAPYQNALAGQGVNAQMADADALVLAGLQTAYGQLLETGA